MEMHEPVFMVSNNIDKLPRIVQTSGTFSWLGNSVSDLFKNSGDQLSHSYEVPCVLTSKQEHVGRAVCSRSLRDGQSLLRIIKPFPAMPHHKRAAAPLTSLPSIPSVLCF